MKQTCLWAWFNRQKGVWLNQHEKFSFNYCETAPWVGLPPWLCLWLRILFLFCGAGPKIVFSFFSTPSVVLGQTWEKLTSSVEIVLLFNRENGNINGIFILSPTSWILSCLSIIPFFSTAPGCRCRSPGLHSTGKMGNISLCCRRWHCHLQPKQFYDSVESSSSWCKRMKEWEVKQQKLCALKNERTSLSLSLCLDSFLFFWLLDSKMDRWTSDLGKSRKESTERLCGFAVKLSFR